MTTYAQLEAKAVRLAVEHGGTVVKAERLKEGDRFFPAEAGAGQVFTVTDVCVDPSPVGNTLHKLMVSTDAQPVFCSRFDPVIKLETPELKPVELEIHHFDEGDREDPMTGARGCLICGAPKESPEHW